MKKRVLNLLETFAKAMVQPLMFFAGAGILMVLGVLITNKSLVELLPFLGWGPLQMIGNLIYGAVMILINNLPVVFAVGIAAALAKKDKHLAGLVGLITYLIYLFTSNTLLKATGNLAAPNPMLGLFGTGQANILGIQVVDMSVFGGIILGCLTGYVYNKTVGKRFKGALQIYSGPIFSFMCMFFIAIAFGAVSNIVWPYAQQGIASLAGVIKNTGNFGLFLYGFLERLLIPTGLHHLIYTPFQFTDLGGVLQLGDKTIAGSYAIQVVELNMPAFSNSIYYNMIGFTKIFGYIGIGLSFIYTAKKENRKKVTATLVPLMITASLANVTEPIDFMFCFVAPLLFVIHAAFAGAFIALMSMLNVTALCSGNILTSMIMNVVQGVEKTKWPIMLLLGLVQIALYFVVFSFLIKKFNYKTPGREDQKEETTVIEEKAEVKEVVETTTDTNSKYDVESIILGLGGKENINSVTNCFTRLRVNIENVDLLNEELINKTKNSGIVKKGNDIQIIFGLNVTEVRALVDEYLNK